MQETHFRQQPLPKMPTQLLNNQWFFSNSPVAKSHGTAIAFHKSCLFKPIESYLNPQGRYVFVKGVIVSKKCATLYAPNVKQLSFIDAVLEKLADFREGLMILGGYFNISPDPLLDTSHDRPTHSHAFLKHFCKSPQNNFLIDTWRALHASDRIQLLLQGS